MTESKIHTRLPGLTNILVLSTGLPLVGIAVERTVLGMRGSWLAPDPFFPSAAHVATCVACCLLLAWTAFASREQRVLGQPPGRAVSIAPVVVGGVLAICVYYGLAMVAMVPMMVMAILGMGMGILGLAPYWCLIGAIQQIRRYSVLWPHLEPSPGPLERRVLLGFAAGLSWMVIIDGRIVLMERWIGEAASRDPAVSSRAVSLLRSVVPRDDLFHRCYTWESRTVWAIQSGMGRARDREDASPEVVRQVFFRVTGLPFNALPPPPVAVSGRGDDPDDSWDSLFVSSREIGGSEVAGRVRGLSLSSSRLDGTVDATAAVAGLAWTMEFTNRSSSQREARLRLALPPGGFGSQLSLWIEGQECQAAFGGRAQVRNAYKQVAVVQRRDPALFSTAGPDEALLQVFPIQPRSTSRVRVGLSAPLVVEGSRAMLRLPAIVERNFDLDPAARHQVWLDVTGGKVAPGALTLTPGAGGIASARGAIDDAALAAPTSGTVVVDVGPTLPTTTCSIDADGATLQELRPRPPARPSGSFVLVIDGSATVAATQPAWSHVLARLPAAAGLAIFWAGDRTERWEGKAGDPAAAAWLAGRSWAGGIDPVPALDAAWEEAARGPAGAILWIHGLLPIALSDVAGLGQKLAHRPAGPRLAMVGAVPGKNVVAEALGHLPAVVRAPRLGRLEDDLARAALDPGEPPRAPADRAEACVLAPAYGSLVRVLSRAPGKPACARPASDHLSRLWAHTRSRELAARGDVSGATDVALRYRLVTPLTGAVVLERKSDYKANDLDPSRPSAVPAKAVPEPGIGWLLAIVLMALAVPALAARPRRRTAA